MPTGNNSHYAFISLYKGELVTRKGSPPIARDYYLEYQPTQSPIYIYPTDIVREGPTQKSTCEMKIYAERGDTERNQTAEWTHRGTDTDVALALDRCDLWWSG